ncbi:MAG: PadR family transcriptional regulator [Chloroflexota bacterium]|nr:PadR family transcriptional regulator [Chloroflexota bacterium]
MPPAEMPAEHAILGLLALGVRPGEGYGYDLARQFSPGQPLADVLRLEPGMLYHHLKKLERVGWVDAAVEPQDARPSRRVYTLTAAGRAELRRWLGAPVARTREIRLEFLVKLYFARRLDPARADQLIADQQETCRRLEASLVQQRRRLDASSKASDDAEGVTFQRLVLDLRLSQTRAAAAWLSEVATAPEPNRTALRKTP